MPVWDDSCSKEIREKLTTAFDAFIEFDSLRNNFLELQNSMRSKWLVVRLECGDNTTTNPQDNCYKLDGSTISTRIRICETKDNRRIPAVLLHELVHACEGSELDAEAVERVCYFQNGAEPPNGKDFKKFCDKYETDLFEGNKNTRVSKFVIWDSVSGEVWVKSQKDGKVVKGTQLFKSDNWKHRCG